MSNIFFRTHIFVKGLILFRYFSRHFCAYDCMSKTKTNQSRKLIDTAVVTFYGMGLPRLSNSSVEDVISLIFTSMLKEDMRHCGPYTISCVAPNAVCYIVPYIIDWPTPPQKYNYTLQQPRLQQQRMVGLFLRLFSGSIFWEYQHGTD